MGLQKYAVDPATWHLVAFICEFGVYKPAVMLFGLQNAPALFQQCMNYILRKQIVTGWVFVYIDNILITTENLEEHWRLVHEVLKALQDDNLTVQENKCVFEASEVTFLV